MLRMWFYFRTILLLTLFYIFILYFYFISPDVFRVSEERCIHPDINAFDEEIMQFYEEPSKCQGYSALLTRLVNGTVVKLRDKSDFFDCWGRCHLFQDYDKNRISKWMNISEFKFRCEIIEVRCSVKGDPPDNATYYNIHTQLIQEKIPPPVLKPKGKLYDVHVIVIDSQSHTQSIRNLPETREYLIDNFEAVDFPYLTKYDDGSRNNLIALWYGKIVFQVDRSERGLMDWFPEKGWDHYENCNRYLDEERDLVKEFKDYGYVTAQVDDWWSTLNYDCKGLKHKRVHHLFLPYVIAYESDPFLSHSLSKELCLPRHKPAIDYLGEFVRSNYSQPKFSWTWHSHVGHNTVWGSKELEPDLKSFLEENHSQLDNSFLIVMGDHGLRFTRAAMTKIGKYERNNPMLMISLPKELRKDEILETMAENAKEIQTHFDIYATLKDILEHQPAANFSARETSRLTDFGDSLLRRQPLPRTCQTLPISPEYCLCQSRIHKDITEKEQETSFAVAEALISRINEELEANELTEKCGTWRINLIEQVILVEEEPHRRYQALIHGVNSHTRKPGSFWVSAYEKSSSDIYISSYDRVDEYGDRGKCEKSVRRKICDCADDLVDFFASLLNKARKWANELMKEGKLK